jgi:hypothetical protein
LISVDLITTLIITIVITGMIITIIKGVTEDMRIEIVTINLSPII